MNNRIDTLDLARKTILNILLDVDAQKFTLDRIVDDILYRSPLERRDIALVHAIVYGVIRWRGRLDWLIGHFSNTPLHKIRREILNILRMGLYQILYMDRIPNSAAVNTSVALAKSVSAPYLGRFVNGILRNVIRNIDSVEFPSDSTNRVKAMAVEKSFQEWLVNRWSRRFGWEEAILLFDAVNTIPPITLRTNTLKINREDLANSILNDVSAACPTGYSPIGLRVKSPRQAIHLWQSFKSGYFQVQDEAAQMVGYLLNPIGGQRILDACAGLGGKTGHIAQLMENIGKIVTLDGNSQKLALLSDEMRRLGVTIVVTETFDLNMPLDFRRFGGRFDAVLLDAPCSGLGVLRRNPDGKWSSSEASLIGYSERQQRFLSNVSQLVKRGGSLVYSVCSFEPEETFAVVENFLSQNTEFVIDSEIQKLPHFVKAMMTEKGYFISMPHRQDMDGFFAVRFRRLSI